MAEGCCSSPSLSDQTDMRDWSSTQEAHLNTCARNTPERLNEPSEYAIIPWNMYDGRVLKTLAYILTEPYLN